MLEHRHPHPHIDPRQPRNDTEPATNPPVFAWKPMDSASGYSLTVAADPDLAAPLIDLRGLTDPLWLPEAALPPGDYYWRWGADGKVSEVFRFRVTQTAAVVEVPPAAQWLARLPSTHPRLYLRPEDIPGLRRSLSGGKRERLQAAAEVVLAQEHQIAEPPFLPDRNLDYNAFFRAWSPVMWESRQFVSGAQTLALAYLATGEARYARAACERMASISLWDPMGSSHLSHNDEAHMSVIWNGSKVCDWVWDQFSEQELALVIEQFRRRGQITYEHMHGSGSYGVTRFDSHAGREIVFLALLAIVFHEHIPEARQWLEWLRPVLCGIWPVWAGDDGAWAEGPSYGLAYVGIMTMFATALKRGIGVDLYRRPFWRGHADWRQWCFPYYAEWMGFGDHSERWKGTWESNADLVELIDRETGAGAFSGYVAAQRAVAETLEDRFGDAAPRVDPQSLLAGPAPQAAAPRQSSVLRVFPAAGWAAFRTDLHDESRDIALIFRSSPFGAVSHSHANQNDFILHAGGRVLAMPSGYYDGYGSRHHTHWVWHTKSHNCVTLSDAGQIMRSHDSQGEIVNAFEDERLAYLCGNADAAYADRASRCRRHVAFLKPHNCFLMVDEFAAAPGIVSALQWNIHSWNAFAVDEEARSFFLVREDSSLRGHFMQHTNAFFSLTDGWDPPPGTNKVSEQWYHQYHLRFTVTGLYSRCALGVVLAPGCGAVPAASVVTERVEATEVARIGEDVLLVNGGGGIRYETVRSEAPAALLIGGHRYEIGDDGVRVV